MTANEFRASSKTFYKKHSNFPNFSSQIYLLQISLNIIEFQKMLVPFEKNMQHEMPELENCYG
jgi:hypothetical protein